jgi:hypothetical protein
MRRVWALLLLGLSLAACSSHLDPALVQGDYQAPALSQLLVGSLKPSSGSMILKLLPGGQAVLIRDLGAGKTESQFGLWSLSDNQVTLSLFKKDPHNLADRKVVEATLYLKVKRSARSLWLDQLEFKKL